MMPEFRPFPKIPRLYRECVITEKIDGTNAQIHITEPGEIFVGSRNGWITPEKDNFGFAAWVKDHHVELLTLGVGSHFGEWFGHKIQRGYGLTDRRFALFNTGKWNAENVPSCCCVVPVLYEGIFSDSEVTNALVRLQMSGSVLAPDYPNPEGIIIFHKASGQLFKKTIEKDEEPKTK